LRESEERHRLLFECSPHPMWVFDAETSRFLAVNETALRKYGWSREQFLSMTIDGIRPLGEAGAVSEDVAVADQASADGAATAASPLSWCPLVAVKSSSHERSV